jgi:hypothetical protein
VKGATGGTVVYDADFFLAKPYAAAAFSKEENKLNLPHAAIWGEEGKATRHELFHVHSLQLLREYARARHVLISNESTKPNSLSVDEVFAYAGPLADSTSPEEDRAWSRKMAEQYLEFVRQALADPTSTFQIEARPGACRPSESLKSLVREAADCVSKRLAEDGKGLDACDAKPVAPLCTGSGGS